MSNASVLADEITRIVQGGIPAANLKQKMANKNNLAPAIAEIILKSTPGVAKQVISAAPTDAVAEAITRIVQGGIPTANLKQKLTNKNNLAPAIAAIIVNSAPGVSKQVISAAPTDAVAEAVVSIVKTTLNSGKNLKTVLKPEVTREITETLGNTPKSNTAKLILKLIQNSMTPAKAMTKPTAEEAVKIAGSPNSNSILKIITEALAKNETPAKVEEIKAKVAQAPKSNNKNTANLIFKVIMNLFKTNGKMAEVPPNFFAVNTFRQANRPKNGRKWYFGTKNGKTGWYLNTGGAVVGPATGPAARPVNGPAARPNFSKFNLSALLKWRRENPINSANVNSKISNRVREMMNKIRYSYSSSDRLTRLVDLLKQLPINFSGRREIVSAIIAIIREITNLNKFSNFTRNLRGVNNRNIRNALEVQRRRLDERRRLNERRRSGDYERRPGNYNLGLRRMVPASGPPRYSGESDSNYNRRRREEVNANALRRALGRAEPPRLGNGGYPPRVNGGYLSGLNAGAPPLPAPQRNAINNVGGATVAVQTVAQVSGGAPEVAKAAEALNETGGNVKLAINVKGASPAAVNAVQKLGGVSQTVKILEGLNTMAQTPETQRRKAVTRRTRRAKKAAGSIRLTELNRVIAAVKKQKLISLIAHNVTRTNNIHPNDEKLKKHYRKVMKSYLLKTPFATIAKKAEKKRVQ